MQTFTLATLETDAGPMPAIGISGRFWRLSELDPKLAARSSNCCRIGQPLFLAWHNAAEQAVAAGGPPSVTAPRLLTPVLYPDKLLAVGANYTPGTCMRCTCRR